MVVGPTNRNPRRRSSLLNAVDSGVTAGTSRRSGTGAGGRRGERPTSARRTPPRPCRARCGRCRWSPRSSRVADDPGIAHQALDVGLVVLGDDLGLEPANTSRNRGRLRRIVIQERPAWKAFERHLLEQRAVAVQRRAPLFIVIATVLVVVAHPGAAVAGIGAREKRGHPVRLSAATDTERRHGGGRVPPECCARESWCHRSSSIRLCAWIL